VYRVAPALLVAGDRQIGRPQDLHKIAIQYTIVQRHECKVDGGRRRTDDDAGFERRPPRLAHTPRRCVDAVRFEIRRQAKVRRQHERSEAKLIDDQLLHHCLGVLTRKPLLEQREANVQNWRANKAGKACLRHNNHTQTSNLYVLFVIRRLTAEHTRHQSVCFLPSIRCANKSPTANTTPADTPLVTNGLRHTHTPTKTQINTFI
jgi:hypothetical protein